MHKTLEKNSLLLEKKMIIINIDFETKNEEHIKTIGEVITLSIIKIIEV